PDEENPDKIYKSVWVKQRNGTTVKNRYDELNRLTFRQVIPAAGVEGPTVENYSYDGMSRLKKADNQEFEVRFDYDFKGRLKYEVLRDMDAGTEKQVDFAYGLEDLGFGERHKKSMAFPEPGGANGWLSRRELRHHFDVLDRLLLTKTDVKNGNSTAETNLNAYEYIGRSYRYLSKQRNNGDVINYLYDQGRRLTGIETKNKNENLINKYVYGYN
ncbi:MAG: hypothetical protein GY841_11985, partial [FCB group bacterium]|nr:hypothetical protein [FCB group bacterium]